MATQRANRMGGRDTKDGGKDATPRRTTEWSKPFERNTVIANAVKASVGLAAVTAALYYYVPIPVPPLPTLGQRVLYTLRLQTPSFLILMASILDVSLTRLFTPALNPISGNAEHYVLFQNRFLRNHVEQMLLNVPGQLVLATFIKEEHMKVIPILVLLFVFGRVAFYVGYRISYMKRTVGYMSSMVPSCVVWLFNAYFLWNALLNNETIAVK
ncbi:hypothetical protein EGW08_008714 [Elysia chlorotica]|uniref:Uncharacterized protein n=1 Tax=Elysia chlorotica TaxID=188477 RepID=A0A433TPN3_ELYCH|nr:hypothetical protein EGW08_008714 [Elysia chlorotica]